MLGFEPGNNAARGIPSIFGVPMTVERILEAAHRTHLLGFALERLQGAESEDYGMPEELFVGNRKGDPPGGKVLDVGCGFGATNLTLADHFPDSEFVGIDLSDPLLEIARERSEERGVSGRVHFEKADAQDIPFEDDSCDVLINLNMVHLVEDPLAMLNEMERVLTPGGILFLADLKRSVLGIFEKEIRSALSTGEAKQLVQASNLRAGDFSTGLVWWRYESLPKG